MKKLALAAAVLVGLALVLAPTDALAAGDDFSRALDRGWMWLFLAAFGYGILTSLTPCVYPMIPITVAVFGAKDQQAGRRRSFLLAACYVEGMAIFYTAIGTPFALAGRGAGQLLANPWVVVPIAAVLVLLAASFFGAFNLNLPASWQTRLAQVGGRGFRGAFAMGLVGGLIAAPCTGPFLAGMIAFIAQTGDPIVGAGLLFAYAHGIGVLFFVLAVSAVSLPKSGPWMDGVKSAGGILLIVGALYFLRPVVPAIGDLADAGPGFLTAALLLAAFGVLIGAVHLSFHSAPWSTRLRKGFGIGIAVVGLTATVNWFMTPERDIGWRYDETVAFDDARASDRYVMVDFAADWCLPCKEIEKIMATEDVFEELTRSFVPLKFDVTRQNDRDAALQEKYQALTLPAVIFLDTDGRELGRYNDTNPSAESFVAAMRRVLDVHPPK